MAMSDANESPQSTRKGNLHPLIFSKRWKSYRYQELDNRRAQIRLIRLHSAYPGLTSSGGIAPVQCDMFTFEGESIPPYVTLSYTWGPPQPTRMIVVNGKWLEVRENLFNFLEAFRYNQSNHSYLWIDQICIDQGNTRERNHQVNLMSQIYKKCTFVIVWLDSSHEKTHGAPCGRREILSNQYFTRLWIVQEVLLAPQIYVLCADSYMFVMWHSWEDLRNEAINGQVFGPGSSVAWLFRSRKREALSPTYHIGDVVRRFADMKCQDPRDKIYGFLGLIPEAKRPVVDYNKSIMEVFLDSVSLLSEGGWGDTLRSTSHIQRIIERTSLCFKLADAMGLPNLDGLHEFFQIVHHTEHRLSLEQDRSIDDIPKIEIHFEATSVDCDPSKTNGRFWFEYHGQRHYQVPTGMFRTSATANYAAVQHDDVPLNWGRSNNLHDAQRFARFADLPQGSRNALSQYDPTWS